MSVFNNKVTGYNPFGQMYKHFAGTYNNVPTNDIS